MLLNSKFHIHIIARMQIKTMTYIQSCSFQVTCVVQMKPINVKIKIIVQLETNHTQIIDLKYWMFYFFLEFLWPYPTMVFRLAVSNYRFLYLHSKHLRVQNSITFPAKETKNTTFQLGWLRTQTSKGLYLNTLFKDTNFKSAIKKSKCYGS